MAEMSGILITLDTLKRCTKRLNDEQKGQLLTAIISFCENGVLDEIEDPTLDLAADVITSEIERMDSRYREKQQKARDSVNKRWKKAEEAESEGIVSGSDTTVCDDDTKKTTVSSRNTNGYDSNTTDDDVSSRNTKKKNKNKNKNTIQNTNMNMNMNKNKNTNTNTNTNCGDEFVSDDEYDEEDSSESDTSVQDSDVFDLSDEDVRKARETDAAIEEQAERYGFGRISEGRMVGLRDLAAEYTTDWLLKAIELADRQQKHTWAYVEGILKTARKAGRIDPDTPGSAAQSEEDLQGWMEVLGNGI